MYTVDDRDAVRVLPDLPRPGAGAPLPRLVSDEHEVRVTYYVREPHDAQVTVTFSGLYALRFGPPNEEAFAGHPLASRGLTPWGAFEVHESSWIRQMERMNSVHPHHQADRFGALRHFVLSFHDTTFECIAEAASLGPVGQVHLGPSAGTQKSAGRDP